MLYIPQKLRIRVGVKAKKFVFRTVLQILRQQHSYKGFAYATFGLSNKMHFFHFKNLSKFKFKFKINNQMIIHKKKTTLSSEMVFAL